MNILVVGLVKFPTFYWCEWAQGPKSRNIGRTNHNNKIV